jgi:hypothetical protein
MAAPIGPGDWRPRKRRPNEPVTRQWFEDRVQFDTNGGCWLWGCGLKDNGYGSTNYAGKVVSAHRLSWHLYRGYIPHGLEVCHRCDVRCCVNPAHLFLGTRSDNMRDCRDKGRSNRPYGERAGNAVLNEAVVLEIARRLRACQPKKAIARELGVAVHNVRWIAKGLNWAWLTGFGPKSLIQALLEPIKEDTRQPEAV